MNGGPGEAINDITLGGAASDAVDFTSAGPGGVTVDLARTDPQDTGGAGTDRIEAEQVVGSLNNDILTGTSGPNTISGQAGSDSLRGAGGTDFLLGNDDPDQIFAWDGETDTVDCGQPNPPDLGADTVETDVAGVDTLANCENQLFPPVPTPTPAPVPVPVMAIPLATPNPACAELRAKLKKADSKRKKRKIRRQLQALAC
jgi:hypothetical protein